MESPFGLRSLPLGFGRPQASFFMVCGRPSEPVLRTRSAAGRLFYGLRPIFGVCPPDSAGRRQAFLWPATDLRSLSSGLGRPQAGFFMACGRTGLFCRLACLHPVITYKVDRHPLKEMPADFLQMLPLAEIRAVLKWLSLCVLMPCRQRPPDNICTARSSRPPQASP